MTMLHFVVFITLSIVALFVGVKMSKNSNQCDN